MTPTAHAGACLPRAERDAVVNVAVADRGPQAQVCEPLLRVQPGRVIVTGETVHLAPGATQRIAIPWPTSLMGDIGPKELVAELFLQGAVDGSPADNQATQLVTVGP